MIEGLERFVVELRRRGIRVSPAECLDAMRAVERVGLAERARFRHALAATLVKRAGERASFDEAFDAFFATPAWGRAGRDPHARGGAGGAARAKPSASDRSEPRSGRPPARPSEPREREARATTRAVLARLAVDAPRDEARQHRRLRRVLARMHGAERRLALPGERREATRRELARTMSFDEEREIAREVSRVIEAVRLRRSRREKGSGMAKPG